MLRYILSRLIVGVLVTFTVSVIVFLLTNWAVEPAIAIAGENATSDDIEAMRKAYNLDRPLYVQYYDWLSGVVRGDLGVSFQQRRPVTEIVLERLPATFKLAGLAFAFAILLSVPLAILAAFNQDTWIDRMALTISLVGQAVPTFWFALICIVIFSVKLRWLPVSGSTSFEHFILPAVSLGYYASPAIMRLTRAGMIDALSSDFVRTARAKGLLAYQVVLKHALRNAVLPVVSVAAVQFGHMLGGSIVIETIFAIRGVGYLAWESILAADLPVVQAIVIMMSGIYILLTILSDIVNAQLDPRIRGA